MSTGQLLGVVISRKLGVCRLVLARSGLFSESESARMSQGSSRWYHLSVREVAWGVVLVGFTAAGFFLHRYFANVGILLMMVLLTGIAIRAMVLPGVSRAFALGFLVPFAMYLAITLLAASPVARTIGYFAEYEAFGGVLTTTQVMQSWVPPRITGPMNGAEIKLRSLNASTLMTCGHLLIAFVLGYIGGKYSQAIYNQSRDE